MPNQSERGLYGKFHVERADGRDQEGGDRAGADYFVLDLTHDAFALRALAAYANACEAEYPQLAADLRAKVVVPPGLRPLCPSCGRPEASLTDAMSAANHARLFEEAAALREQLRKEDEAHANTIGARDARERTLDEFVQAVNALTGDDYGEHSTMNDPWENALEGLNDLRQRDEASELRAALEGIVELLSKPKTDPLRGLGRVVGAIAIARTALAGGESGAERGDGDER